MAKISKIEVFQKMEKAPIVPVFYHQDISIAQKVVQACYKAGIRAFEFTNRGDFAHEVFASLVKFIREECPEMAIGIGSVVEAGTASLYLQLGADFVVSPLWNPDIAKVCHRRGVPYVPGCATLSEIGQAQEAGCDLCKVFPGEVLGSSFVKSVLAPMPWTRIMVTGGVEPTQSSLQQWFEAGVSVVGMGSKLFPTDLIAQNQWDTITEFCQNALQLAQQAKK